MRLITTPYYRAFTCAPVWSHTALRLSVAGLHTQTRMHNGNEISDIYQEAVAAVNSLQSNARTIALTDGTDFEAQKRKFEETLFYLNAVGVTQDDLKKLQVIHVSGTKGKGTTCAYTESILRRMGVKTGLYCSPHLVQVRERIQINGEKIGKELFSKRVFEVLELVKNASERSNVPMPPYFKFMTVLAFYTFMHENVEAAVMEVGIGGEFDCTNVIQHPVVCGITTLDIDHTSMLGNTILSIAWHKAGIMKSGAKCFVCEDQAQEAWGVLRNRAKERETTVEECRHFADHEWGSEFLEAFSTEPEHQKLNAALAVQLATEWWRVIKRSDLMESFGSVKKALSSTHWAGRNQVLQKNNITYFLDGAHTMKSIECCSTWFQNASLCCQAKTGATPLRFLIFHCTGDRNPEQFLRVLQSTCHFDYAFFTPPRLYALQQALSSDTANLLVNTDAQLQKCKKCLDIFTADTGRDNAKVLGSISDTLGRISQLAANNQNLHVLVTGSLYLVGGVLNLEDPSFSQ